MVTASDFTYRRMPVTDLRLDKNNPRIAQWLEMYKGEITAEQMSLALGAAGGEDNRTTGTTFRSLRESIRTNGGIIHPIIVNSTSNGYVVIEGNTRALIFQEFGKRGEPGDWDTIPALLYHDLDQTSVDAIRLQAHLVGPREWLPYSKAKYLHLLRNSQHLTWGQIVDFCGGGESEARNLVAAYEDMEGHYRPQLNDGEAFDASRFSAFVELQRSRVQGVLVETGYTKTDFASWVKDRLIYPLNTVRLLPRILRDPRSSEIFFENGASEAQKVLDMPSPDAALQDASFEALARELSRRVLTLNYSELQRLRADLDTDEIIALTEARDHLDELCNDIASSD